MVWILNNIYYYVFYTKICLANLIINLINYIFKNNYPIRYIYIGYYYKGEKNLLLFETELK